MPHEVLGVIAQEKGAPASVEAVLVPEPGPGEALVAVQACGVCHTDLLFRDGGVTDGFPILLGHEAAGVVEATGPDVDHVVPGDFVVLNWKALCGTCRNCRRGRPWCLSPLRATQRMRLAASGTDLSAVLGVGGFCEKTLVAAGQCTTVDPSAPPEAACLVGCGVTAGLGAAMHTGAVRPGDSVAVFGCGGVGCAAIAGAQLAGATTIVAIDIDPRKLDLARSLGATHVVNSAETDAVEQVRAVTNGIGVDVCIEAVGDPGVYQQAFEARDVTGTLVLVGVPPAGTTLELPFRDVYSRGGALKTCWYGDCLPERDFRSFVDLYLQGRLDLDAFVSDRIGLDDVEKAFHRMAQGEVIRSVVTVGP